MLPRGVIYVVALQAVLHDRPIRGRAPQTFGGRWLVLPPGGAGRLAFLRSLVARGLTGVQLVISDAHEGLKGAIEAVLVGAAWQRCRTHAMRNLMTKVPKPRSTDSRASSACRWMRARRSRATTAYGADLEIGDVRFHGYVR